MGKSKSRRGVQRPRRKGPTPRKRLVPAAISDDVSEPAVETARSTPASARYTPPRKNRGLFRPVWHKVVGAVLIVVGLTLFIACEASLWGIHTYGGHIWYMVGLLAAGSSMWWFGLFDRSETRW